MLKFLFGGRGREETTPETQREAITRLMDELNTLVGEMPQKPKIIVDPNSGAFSLELPETMPDEALALPAPQDEASSDEAEAGKTDEIEAEETPAKAA